MTDATQRFTDRADAYRAGRPSYPTGAIDALVADVARDGAAVDLGAGTGISSRLLADRGLTVLAVEPNAAMRDAAEPHRQVRFVAATADATGLPAASADLVTAFQAFHWFATDAALAEMQRLLRPGGRCAIVYNERDANDAFTRAFGELVRRYATDDTEARRESARHLFASYSGWASVCERRFANTQPLDRVQFAARAASVSYLPQRGPAADVLRGELDALFERFAESGVVEMRMSTSIMLGTP